MKVLVKKFVSLIFHQKWRLKKKKKAQLWQLNCCNWRSKKIYKEKNWIVVRLMVHSSFMKVFIKKFVSLIFCQKWRLKKKKKTGFW